MANSGVAYMTSKEGILRAIIILFTCIAFALLADAGATKDVLGWILAAYILAFCMSLLSYFFIATTLASKMECGISYDTVDVCLSVFNFYHCLLASIILATYLGPNSDQGIAADVFGFLLSILYAVEVYFLKDNAPGNLDFLVTPRGIVKTVIFIFGCTTFALLDNVYEAFNDDGCDAGRTWGFAAYIYCWIVSTILLILRLVGLDSKIGPFDLIDMVWSFFSCFNYLVASIVVAAYIECNFYSERRVAAVVFGFLVAIVYAVDGVMGKLGGKGGKASKEITPSA